MPAQDRVGLNDAGQTEQAWPEPSHPYQQCPVTPTQSQTVRWTPQGNIELMPKKEILDFKPASRLEQVGDKRPKQMEHGKHRGGWCPDSPSTRESARMEFSGMTALEN
jgi:hypothetical protein